MQVYPLHGPFSVDERRMASFADFIQDRKVTESCVRAGFFLFAENDFRCFWCDCKVTDVTDLTREKHMSLEPCCPFARVVIGREPTAEERDLAITQLMQDPVPAAMLRMGIGEEDMHEALGLVFDRKLEPPKFGHLMHLLTEVAMRRYPSRKAASPNLACKICLEDEVAVSFQPCGHLMACIPCSGMMNTCPLCRADVVVRQIVML